MMKNACVFLICRYFGAVLVEVFMLKAVIFDMDGLMVDTENMIHRKLNKIVSEILAGSGTLLWI